MWTVPATLSFGGLLLVQCLAPGALPLYLVGASIVGARADRIPLGRLVGPFALRRIASTVACASVTLLVPATWVLATGRQLDASAVTTEALCGVLGMAACEELFFRGYVREILRSANRAGGAIRAFGVELTLPDIAATVLFVLAHVARCGWADSSRIMIPGLIFAWCRVRSGGITAGTLFHATCNLAARCVVP